jgi:undecaprenyl-phosphate galactose phosphotransferase
MLAQTAGATAPDAEVLAQITREDVPFSIIPFTSRLPVFGMAHHSFLCRDVLLLTRSCNLEQFLPRLTKRSMDVVFSAAALLFLSLPLLTIAGLIALDGGSPFFGHRRIGVGGLPFSCWKFRTMRKDGDAVLARYLAQNSVARAEWMESRKLREDPRVTCLGGVLRRLSLDELPQLFNVLVGEMSLVGPRPIVVAEAARYDSDIAHYYRVRPGITGLWQISGRSDISYDERVRLDSWYVRNWTLWNDIVILFKTVPALLGRSGAY